MEELLNLNVKALEISGIRQFYNRIAGVTDVISFSIGEPDFPTPEHIKLAAIQAIEAGKTTYTHNAGLLSLREAAANFFRRKYDLVYRAEDEIITTNGASEAIDIALRTILSPGDEVLLPGPIYPGYEPVIRMCQATAVHVDTRNSGFKITAEQLEQAISSRTKCVILPYPSNPTGVSLTADELRDMAEVVRGKEIFILTDEVYSELTFERKHFSIASILPAQTIVINGLSKSHAMTGWRIGFLLAPSAICREILKVHQYNVTCASSISQYAALEAMTNGFDDSLAMRAEYRDRRDYVYNRLQKIGLTTTLPDGAFYFFVKVPKDYDDDFTFAVDLVEKAKVAVVPGSAFSPYGSGYFRLSYACSRENLQVGLNRLEKFLAK